MDIPVLKTNGHERLASLDKSMPPASPTLPSPTIRRNKSDGKLMAQDVKEARVKVIYTGGTIGMVRNERNGKQPRMSRIRGFIGFARICPCR